MRTIEDALSRLRAEFLEMPGLWLTLEQVQRLCGIERAVCRRLLDSLVNEAFLSVRLDGQYGRRTDDTIYHPRPAKADLRAEQHFLKAS